jgi:hypothetical protein
MRIKDFILVPVLILPHLLSAQYSDFDLSKYKLPDIKLNRLDTYFDMGNSSNRFNFKPSDSDTSESKQFNFQGTLNLNYYYFRNSEKYQGEINAMTSGSMGKNKSENDENKFNSDGNNVNLRIININRFYNRNLYFIEIDPDLSMETYRTTSESTGSSVYDNSNNRFTTNFSLPVSIGHGRIEPVEDLRLAIYILEELKKAGRIESLPTDEVVLGMAREISRIKRKRFFDARIRKIEELQVIDSFLIANNIVSSGDITYFTVLNDQWDYAAGPPRSAGFAVNAGIDDRLVFDRSHNETSDNGGIPDIEESYTNAYYIGGFSQARYEKPHNLYWQSSAFLKIAYGFEFARDPQNQDNPAENFETGIFNTMLGYSVQFLPNSRTSAELSFAADYFNSRGERTISNPDPMVYQMTDNRIRINTGFDMYYYVSPRFRVRLNTNLNYYTLSDLKTNDINPAIKNILNSYNHNLSLKLIYSFF